MKRTAGPKDPRQLVVALGIGVSVFAVACGGGAAAPPPDTVAPVSPSAVVFQTDRLGIGELTRSVILDENEWTEVWSKATTSEPSAQLSRPIDFATEMVLVAATGRMDTGAQIRFESAGLRNNEFVVTVVTVSDCAGFTSDVYPVAILRVERSEQPVRWVEKVERAPRCG